jgi:putative hemolysin
VFALDDPPASPLWWTLLGLASVPALVALNGFFVAAEFALVAVRKTRVEEMVAQRIRRAKAVLNAIEHLDRSIAATQLGITLSSIGLGWISEQALAHVFELGTNWVPGLGGPIARHSVATALAIFLVTFLHVVFGELCPKTVALQSPARVSLWVAAPLSLFERCARPVIWIMNGSGNAIVRWIGFRATGESMVHSVEELALLIEDTEEAGILDPEQAELVQNVFLLSDKRVKDCMVPREKMEALEASLPSDRVLEAVRSGAHTRMPVYEKEFDNIVGVVNTKDLFYLFSLQGVVVLEDAIYPALFLKPDEAVAKALKLFRKAKRPMALVRDDEGTILGLITLEDILEEIIGDIEDEHDHPMLKMSRAGRLRQLRYKQGEKK